MDLHDVTGESLAALIDRDWVLAEAWGGQIKSVNQLSKLTLEESRRVLTDAVVIRFFTRDVSWTQTWSNWMAFQAALKKLALSHQAGGAALELRREIETATIASLQALTVTVARLSEPPSVINAVSPSTDEHSELLEAINWAPRVDKLRRVWAARPSTWTDLADQSDDGTIQQYPVFTPAVVAALNLETSTFAAVESYLNTFIHDAELVFAHILQDCEEVLISASRNLKELTVGVLGGQAVLLDQAGLKQEPLVLHRFDLELESLQSVHIALRNAQALLADYKLNSDVISSGPGAEPEPEPGLEPEPVDNERGSPIRAQEASEEPAPTDEPGAMSPEPLLDLRGLLMNFRSLTSILEERWSDALEYSLSRTDSDVELARWSSVVAAIVQATEEREQRDSVVIPSFPLGRTDLSSISPTAKGDAKRIQEEIASIYTFQALLSAIPALQSPPNARLSFTRGEQSTKYWWSSGGFYFVRTAADLSVRMTEEIARNNTDVEMKSIQTDSTDLALAVRAYQMGMPEASIVYLNRALKTMRHPNDQDKTAELVEKAAMAVGEGGGQPPLDYLICLLEVVLNPGGNRVAPQS